MNNCILRLRYDDYALHLFASFGPYDIVSSSVRSKKKDLAAAVRYREGNFDFTGIVWEEVLFKFTALLKTPTGA
jgi:hypothetical protein